jgi:transglutaminase-like putative cysteine protease
MIYDIRQVTTYRYATAAAYARHMLRLTPIDRSGQRVHAAAIEVEPTPVRRREGRDFFGNRMTHVELDRQHDSLSVRVAARVAVETAVAPEEEATPPWEAIRERAAASIDLAPAAPAHFLFASRQVSLDPEIRDYAAESFRAGRRVLAAAAELMRRIN